MTIMATKKLKKDPILEAMFEVRFELKDGIPSEFIPGVLFKELSASYPTFEALVASTLPKEVRLQDPNLDHLATHKFSNDDYTISAGQKVFVVSCSRPYKHWESYKPVILSALNVLFNSGLVKRITRIGLRYLNLIEVVDDLNEQYKRLNINCSLGGFDILNYTTNVRTEILLNGFKNVVSINPGAKARLNKTNEELGGLILDINTICEHDLDSFFSKQENLLDDMHRTESEIFFKSISDLALHELDS